MFKDEVMYLITVLFMTFTDFLPHSLRYLMMFPWKL